MKEIEQLDVTKPADVTTPEIWSDVVEKAARSNVVMTDYIRVNEALRRQGGDTINIPKETGEIKAGDVSELTSATADPTTYTIDKVSVDPSAYGAMVSIHKDTIQNSNVDVLRHATESLGEAIAQLEDEYILGTAAQHAVGTVVAYSGDGAGNMTYQNLVEAVRKVRAQDFEPSLFVINSNTEAELGTISEFVEASKYGEDAEFISEAAIGRVLGMDVVSTENVPEDIINASGGTASCIVADPDNAVVEAVQENTTVEEDYNVKGQSHEIVATKRFGIEGLNKEATCVVATD